MTHPFTLHGQRLHLRGDRSLFWEEATALVVADPHFGKVDAFRAAGMPVPGGPDEALSRLATALDETRATRLVVLGDFWHARGGITGDLGDRLAGWKAERPAIAVDLIRGNHDRACPPPAGWGGWHEELHDPPFVFAHFPEPTAGGYVLAGHLHPGVLLVGRGRDRLKLPAFRFADRVGVLPAFGGFTGLAVEVPRRGERVFAVADGQIVPLG